MGRERQDAGHTVSSCFAWLRHLQRVTYLLAYGWAYCNGMTDDPQAPWGGFKLSGVGREYVRYGIEAFLEPRAILERLS